MSYNEETQANISLKEKCYGYQEVENRFLDVDKPVILHLKGSVKNAK